MIARSRRDLTDRTEDSIYATSDLADDHKHSPGFMRAYPFWLYLATFFSLLGSLQFGYHLGVLNTSLDYVLKDLDQPGLGAVIVSAVLIGATGGALAAGTLADKLGPKRAIVLNTLPFVAGAAMSATATGATSMITGRLLTGVASGAASLFVPRYLAEIAPVSIRGLLGTLHQITINLGIVLVFALGLPYQNGPHSVLIWGHMVPWWRVMFGLAAVPALIQAAGMAVCPETPVWLMFSGFHLQASKSYRKLHGRVPDLATEAAAEDLDQLVGFSSPGDDSSAALLDQPLLNTRSQPNNSSSGTATGGFSALFSGRYRRIMILAATLPLLQQLSGINSVVLYGSEVFRKAGVKSPVVANLLLGLVNTLATVGAAVLMDRAGRKKLLTWSYGGMAICLLGMATLLILPTPQSFAGPISFVAILLYIACFALGSGPITWLYLPEILPPEIKGTAQSTVTALNWLANFLIGMCFPYMLRVLGFAFSYIVFGICCAAGAVFCQARMVETKQRSLENIQAELMSSTS